MAKKASRPSASLRVKKISKDLQKRDGLTSANARKRAETAIKRSKKR